MNHLQAELFDANLNMAYAIASQFIRRMGGRLFSAEEVLQSARIALFEAARRFDPPQGIPEAEMPVLFRAYARMRIQGELIEEVRRKLGRTGRPARPSVVSIEAFAAESTTDAEDERRAPTPPELRCAPSIDDPLLKRHLDRCISALPEREEAVIRGRYERDGQMIDLAVQLGVSQARVSQLHTKAIQSLAAALGAAA